MSISNLVPTKLAIYSKTKKSEYAWLHSSPKLVTDVHRSAAHLLATSKKALPLLCVYKANGKVGLLLGGMDTERYDGDNRIVKSSLFVEFQTQDEEKVLSTVAYLLRSPSENLAKNLKSFITVAEAIYQQNEGGEETLLQFPAVIDLEKTDRATYESKAHEDYFKYNNVLPVYSTEKSRENYANYVLSVLPNFDEYCFVSTDMLSIERCQTLAETIKNSDISDKRSKSDLKVIILSCSESVKKLPDLTLFNRLDEMGHKAKGVGIFFLVLAVGSLIGFLVMANQINEQIETKNTHEAEVKKLGEIKTKLESDLETLEEDKELLEKTVTGMRNETNLDVFNKAKAELRKIKDEEQAVQKTVKEQLRKAEEEKDNIIAEKQKELDELKAAIDQKRNEFINLKQPEDTTKPLNEQIQELQAQLQEKNKEIAGLKNELENIEGKRQAAKEELEKFLMKNALNSNGKKAGSSIEKVLSTAPDGSYYKEAYCDNYLGLRETAEKLGTVNLGKNLCDGYNKKIISTCQCYNVVPKEWEKAWYVKSKDADYYLPTNINPGKDEYIESPDEKSYYQTEQEGSCKNQDINVNVNTLLNIHYKSEPRFKTSRYRVICETIN